MAGKGGYFLKGLAGGIQSGFNMGIQIQEMQWQKAQRKKLKEKEEKIKEGMLSLGNLIKQCGVDGVYSSADISLIDTAFLASATEVQATFKGSLDHIKTMNKKELEEDYKWIDLVISQMGDVDPKDAQGMFDYVKGWIKTEGAKNYITAYENIQKRKSEIAKPIAEVFTTAEAVKEAYPGAGYEYSATAGGYVPTFQKPEAPKTELDIMGETKKRLDYAYATGNASYFNRIAKSLKVDTTFETYKKGYKEPEEVKPKERAISLPLQEDYIQKVLESNTWTDAQTIINRYAKAGYDTSEMPVKQGWIDAKFRELDSHLEMLKEITDKEGKLLGDKKFNFMSGDKAETKTGEQWYRDIYEAYMFYLDELRKMGIDVSRYLKIKSPKEVSKVGFLKGMFTGGGVERGYPSIYYK